MGAENSFSSSSSLVNTYLSPPFHIPEDLDITCIAEKYLKYWRALNYLRTACRGTTVTMCYCSVAGLISKSPQRQAQVNVASQG